MSNASLHRNVLSLVVWQGQEQREGAYLEAITHSIYPPTVRCRRCILQLIFQPVQDADVPDEGRRIPRTPFSSVTAAARKDLPLHKDTGYHSTPPQHVKVSPLPQLLETSKGKEPPMSRMRVSNTQLGAYRQNSAFMIPDELQQVYSAADASTASGQGLNKVQLVQLRPSYTEGDSTSQASYQSCIHLKVPLTSFRSVVYLYKSLLIPLFKLDESGAGQSTLYRSTLSVRLGVSRCCRFPTKNEKRSCGLRHYRDPLSKSKVHKVEQMAPTCVNSEADHSHTQCLSNTLGLLSFRRTSPSNTKAGSQKGNADEKAFLTQGNSREKKHTSNTGMNFITSYLHSFQCSVYSWVIMDRSHFSSITARYMWYQGGFRGWNI